MKLAVDFLQNNRRTVLQTELLSYISEKRGTTKERVRGTVIKHDGGLLNPELLAKLGVSRERSPARFVVGAVSKEPHANSYDCPVKRGVVRKLLSYVSGDSPVFVTMAGHEGLDVAQFLNLHPQGQVRNFERDAVIAARFQANHPSIPTMVSDFSSAADLPCDLAFYDSVGYASDSMEHTLLKFNRSRASKFLAVTMLGIRRFRNTGEWAELARALYTGSDPTKSWIEDLMSNYELVEEIEYTKTNVKGARKMRVFMFRRRYV
jgi:hypothetical protein